MNWRQTLRVQTHNPAFLQKMVAGILLAGLALGIVVQLLPLRPLTTDDSRTRIALLRMDVAKGQSARALKWLESVLADSRISTDDVLRLLPELHRQPGAIESGVGAQMPVEPIDADAVRKRLQASSRGDQEKQIALLLWDSLVANRLEPGLVRKVSLSPPKRHANTALAVFHESTGDDLGAAVAYEREGRLFREAEEARRRAIFLYLNSGDTAAIERLAIDPDFADAIPPIARMRLATANRDWLRLWWLIPQNEWERFSVGPALLALLAGAAWLAVAMQAGQVWLPSGARWWLCLLAVLLGILSIWPTHLAISWQEADWGLQMSTELADGLLYFVAGVGLREEFCKLLLLVPLLPWLARRGNELEALIVSSCVGLGFAILENQHYFASGFGTSSVGRFLTANFFHMAATGLIGLALIRAVRNPRQRGGEALAVFAVMVVAHGLYDAAIVLPDLVDYSIASSIIYILLAYKFFHELRSMRSRSQETISLTATFLGGLSLLIAVSYIYLSAYLGAWLAARAIGAEVIATAMMAYMFLREMPNSLVGSR